MATKHFFTFSKLVGEKVAAQDCSEPCAAAVCQRLSCELSQPLTTGEPKGIVLGSRSQKNGDRSVTGARLRRVCVVCSSKGKS